MAFRDLVLDAIRMNSVGKTRFEIYRHITKGALLHGEYAEHGDDSNFEIRLVAAGEVIQFDGKGYSYSHR